MKGLKIEAIFIKNLFQAVRQKIHQKSNQVPAKLNAAFMIKIAAADSPVNIPTNCS